MKPHASVWTAPIAALTMWGASSASLAQTADQSAERFTLSGSCLEQTRQLTELVARDLVEVTDVTAEPDKAANGAGWALPGATDGSSENAAAPDAVQDPRKIDVAEQSSETTPAASQQEASTIAASTTTSTAQEPMETDPLVLTMADGSTVDLSGKTEEALAAVPKDNWFGQSPDIDTAKSYLASAAELGEAGNEEACMQSLGDAKVALGMEENALSGETTRQ